MRIVLLILSAFLSLGVVAPLSASASAGSAAMDMSASDTPQDSGCPDDCCEDCPDFTHCLTGCAVAVLPGALADALPARFRPDEAAMMAPYPSVDLPPATPPPRAAVQP